MAFLRALFVAYAITCVHAAVTPLDSSVQVRHSPGHSVEDTYHAIKRGLALASLENREASFKADPINIARSWSGATLLSVQAGPNQPLDHQNGTTTLEAGIEVTCRRCYVKGVATAELTIDGDFDAEALLNNTADSVKTGVQNLTSDFKDYLVKSIEEVEDTFDMSDGIDASDFDFDFPTFNLTFDLDVPTIEDANLHFQFDDMELYLEIGTTLSAGATYEITLFATQTPVGMKIGQYLMLGAVVTVDLILAVEGAIDISSGFHIKLDDGVAIDLPLFGNEVADMTVNGGQFEFLPVTLESASISMSAALRVGAHCGLEVVPPEPPAFNVFNMNFGPPAVEAGIEVAVFANIADFNTNITYAADDEDCKLKVLQEYNFAVGAIAGASVAVTFLNETKTWGPVAELSTAIFTTTLAEVCGIQGKPTPAPTITPGPERRQDLTETVISTEITRSGVSCNIPGPANCPNSEQVSTTTKFSSTITTSVAPGVEATWPVEASDTVEETIAFGTQAKIMRAVSGKPTPYVAPPDEDGKDGSDHVHDLVDGSTGGVSNKIIIGVCVGLVLPILVAIIGAVIFFRRRKRYAAVGSPAAPMIAKPYTGHNDYKDRVQESKSPSGGVSEMRR